MSFPSMFRMCPFPIVAIASKPASVRRAVRKPPKPSPSRVRRFIRRRSCSAMSCRYWNVAAASGAASRRHFSFPRRLSGMRQSCAGSPCAPGPAPCERTASPPRRVWPRAKSRSSARGCPPRDTDKSIDPNVGLVHAPGTVARAEMRPEPPLEFDGVSLDPTGNRRALDLHAAIQQHRLRIAATNGDHRMPPHRPQDRLGGELPSLEFLAVDHSPAPSRQARRMAGPDQAGRLATEPCGARGSCDDDTVRYCLRRSCRRILVRRGEFLPRSRCLWTVGA
jgi:hypothetical protein